MSIEAIVAKLKAVEGLDLTEAEIKEIQGTQTIDLTPKLNEEKAAKARILEEKKAAKARADELEVELEALKSKDLSDSDKVQKEIEKAAKAQGKLKEEYELLQKEHATTVKSYQLEKIGGTIKFMDTIPKDLAKLAVERSFGEIDMNDEDAVKEAHVTFKESYASILASDNAATGSGATKGTVSTKKSDENMTVEERAKAIKIK